MGVVELKDGFKRHRDAVKKNDFTTRHSPPNLCNVMTLGLSATLMTSDLHSNRY